MSTPGKLRRERSSSRERHSRKEVDKRSDSSRHGRSPNVSELNEEEYDEEWEHEWEDIEEVSSSTAKYHKPYGKNQNPKWRGRGQHHGQNRFNKWDLRNQPPNSDYGSDSGPRPRRKAANEDESLEMASGVEITNLKVKIQDGKRFAEPNEKEDFENASVPRYYSKFPRGRGSRGYHATGRERWNQGNRYKHTLHNDVVDCREVLNRRKRHYPDPNESDLREKLLRKDAELGDLREIIESRDSGMDLRDIIEPPDLSLMDDFGDDIVGELDPVEDINLRIHNEYFDEHADHDRNLETDLEADDFETEAERFESVEEQDIMDDIPPQEILRADVGAPPRERWASDRWHQPRSHDASFDGNNDWPDRKPKETFSEEDWREPYSHRGSPGRVPRSRSPRMHINEDLHDRISNHPGTRSQETRRSPPPRNRRERSTDCGARPGAPRWEEDRAFGPVRELSQRELNVRVEGVRRGSFEKDLRMTEREDRGRRMQEEVEQIPIFSEERTHLRSPPAEPIRRRERSIERERIIPRIRNTSADSGRMIVGERRRESHERNSNLRSVSAERGRMMNQERNHSVGHERNRSIGKERNRSPLQSWALNRDGDVDRDRSIDRGRNRSFSSERKQEFERDGHRNYSRETNRNFDQERNRSFENKRSVVRDSRWEPNRSTSRGRSPPIEKGASVGRDKPRRPVGPRTPSEEGFRAAEASWERSPGRIRPQNSARERSRSRARERSRGREVQGRIRDHKNKPSKRTKEPEHREKPLEESRRRDFEQTRSQNIQPNRPYEVEPRSHRNVEKEPSLSSKSDRHRKREHEEDISKDRARGRPRTLDPPEKGVKKTPQMLVEEFKIRHIRESGKAEKYNRRDDFTAKQGRDIVNHDYSPKQVKDNAGGMLNQQNSREWENIGDFQERRSVQSAVGLPFLEQEPRRPRENSSRDQHLRNQGSRDSRNVPVYVRETQPHSSGSGNYHSKEQPMSWTSQGTQQQFSHPVEDRHQDSRWSSPDRRERPPERANSHKPALHPSQSAASSNGKADEDFWRRNLPSLGESQWSKPRSDLSSNPPRDAGSQRPPPLYSKGHQSAKEVIFVRGLARDITDMDIRKDISDCGLWPKDVRVVRDVDTGVSRGLAFITFNSVDEATRWMDLRGGVLNLRPNNHAAMDYSNPISRDWECVRCHIMNFKNRPACYQCLRPKEDCLDGWQETCPYPTHALLLRGLNPLSSLEDVVKALKSRMVAQSRLDGVKMGVDGKGRPRSVCFIQLTSVTDSMFLHKSLVQEPLIIDSCQVCVAYCQLDKLPPMDPPGVQLHASMPIPAPTLPPAAPLSISSTLLTNNIPVVTRTSPTMPAPPPSKPTSNTSIRSMLEGNYAEKDIPILAQYCASAYAKNPQEQAAYVRYYTKHYREKLIKLQAGGK